MSKIDYNRIQQSIDVFTVLYQDCSTGEYFDAEEDMQALLGRAIALERVAELGEKLASEIGEDAYIGLGDAGHVLLEFNEALAALKEQRR